MFFPGKVGGKSRNIADIVNNQEKFLDKGKMHVYNIKSMSTKGC